MSKPRGRKRLVDPPPVLNFRAAPDLVRLVDQVAAQESRPGVTLSRTDALKLLLCEALKARGLM